MSFLSFLKSALTLFISNFPEFVARLIKKIPEAIKKELDVVIVIVNGIKHFADSKLADVLTDIIPGHLDDEIKEYLRRRLPIVLEKLNMLKDGKICFCGDKVVNAAKLHGVACILSKELTGASFGQAAITAEVIYQNS